MLIERLCLTILAGTALALAESPGVIQSHRASADFALSADSNAASWKGVEGIFMENGPKGDAHPDHRTEVRSRWTKDNVYFLFVCPYEALHLHPNPRQTSETNQLWDWDVAEVFVGTDFAHIRKYKEFEMSPQGEWVDLDIDRDNPKGQEGMKWNSGYSVKGRIDAQARIWYGEMRIPFRAIDARPPQEGRELRIGLYRIAGLNPKKYYAWRPTGETSFHVPKAFGTLRLR